MNENLEELKKIKINDKKVIREALKIWILEDFEKRIKELELKSSYILTDEELVREKVGGTN